MDIALSDNISTNVSAIRRALTIHFTEKRLLDLFSEGKLFGTVHTCIGQEFVGVAVAEHLREGDYVFSNHRCHGHFIARCDDVEGLVAEVMGKSTGVCGGLGGSQHLHQDRFFSNGIQGGIAPAAAGLAYAQKMSSSDGIAVVFVGDGTLGEGTLYEVMNLASKWDLPLLFVLENNGYAQSTHQSQTLAGSIPDRFRAFGIETRHGDTWNWENLIEDMGDSVRRVRSDRRPLLHQVDTYRLMAHSKGDDNRDPKEVAPFEDRDPIHRMLTDHADAPWLKQIVAEVTGRLETAVSTAESASVAVLDRHPVRHGEPAWKPRKFERQRIIHAIRSALQEALDTDPKVMVLGEDVESPYGGAFKATAGLSQIHPGRVRNTPISEAAITGVGSGLALAGYRPVVEIMFGDFITLAVDQWINHAAKFRGMYNGQARVPLIVRTPMGGRRGYGPTHSQSLEKLFLGVPDTRVLCLHHRYCPASLYRDIFSTIDRPTMVIENKVLYGSYADPVPPAGYQLLYNQDVFPVARLKPDQTPDLTVVAVGGAALEVEAAVNVLFEEHEIVADVFMPTQLYPFDASCLGESVSQTGRLLIVEEGQGFASASSEIIAQIAESGTSPHMVYRRLSADPRPIPSARPLEQLCLPSVEAIVTKARETVDA